MQRRSVKSVVWRHSRAASGGHAAKTGFPHLGTADGPGPAHADPPGRHVANHGIVSSASVVFDGAPPGSILKSLLVDGFISIKGPAYYHEQPTRSNTSPTSPMLARMHPSVFRQDTATAVRMKSDVEARGCGRAVRPSGGVCSTRESVRSGPPPPLTARRLGPDFIYQRCSPKQF